MSDPTLDLRIWKHSHAALERENAALRAELNEIRGTPEARFHAMLHALLERFPDPSPAAAPPVELRILEAIDALRAERDDARMRNAELRALWAKDVLRAEAAESRVAAMEAALTALERDWRNRNRTSSGPQPQMWQWHLLKCADELAALRARLTPETKP